MSDYYNLFDEAVKTIYNCIIVLEDYGGESLADDTAYRGEQMFKMFLSFCKENGIIEDFDPSCISDVFNSEPKSESKYHTKPDYTFSEMCQYGYTWWGMIPINVEHAKELYNAGRSVCLLAEDGTECYAEGIEDIEFHAKCGGIFGVEREG